jgi:hypothetical protein
LEGKSTVGAMMFKAERSADGDAVIFALSGRIRGEDVAELHTLFGAEAADRHLVLDLQETKLVDRGVVKFFSRCEAGGIALKHCPAYIREWIQRERDGR